jgi:hypothetical protein
MNREGREFDTRLFRRGKSGSKDPRYNFEAITQTKIDAGRWFPPDKSKSTAASKLSSGKSGCATQMPGWRGEELLRL